MTPRSAAAPATPGRTAAFAALALAAVVLVLHGLGAGRLQGVLWGSDAYGFLPGWALPAGALALLAALAAAWRVRDDAPGAAPPAWTPAAAALVAFALFWFAREGHTLLGDGNPLTRNLPRGERFHPHEPLTAVIQHFVYTTARRWFDAPGRDPADVARDAVALGSAFAGALFVALAFPLGRALASLGARDATPRPGLAAWATALLLAQGYAQLFFGYVENYTWVTLAIGAWLWALLAAAARRVPVVVPGVLLVLCVSLHLAATLLAPAWLLLAAFALADPARRAAAARDVALVALAAVGMRALLGALGDGYDVLGGLAEVFGRATQGHGEGGRFAYLVSGQHALDLLNVATLVGPAAVVTLGLGLAAAVARRRDPVVWLLAAAALPPLAAACATGDLNLGFPRDWDLFAPYAVVYTAAGIGLLVRAGEGPRPFALLLAASLFHTVPWVAVNASFERSFARFKTLPLGFGRTESVVGQWYFDHGDAEQARVWLQRATQVNPGNTAAQWLLGLMALDGGREDEAVARFEAAVRGRPDKTNYRLSLVDALALSARPADALPHLRVLLEREPARTEWRGCAAILLVGAGDRAAAVAAAEAAAAAAPGDTLRASLLAAVRGGEEYVPLMKRWWDPLVLGPAGAAAPD